MHKNYITFFLQSLEVLGRPRLHLLGRLEYTCALFFLYFIFIFLAMMEDVFDGRKSSPECAGTKVLALLSNCLVSCRNSLSLVDSVRL